MALSEKARKRFEVAMARRAEAQEILAAIEAPGSLNVAANVAELGATSDLTALVVTAAVITDSAGTYVLPAAPTGAEVDTAIDELRDKVETAIDLKADNADVETLRTEAEARMDAVEAKVDEILAALVAAGLMDV